VLLAPCITYHAYAEGGIRTGDGNEKEMYDSDQRIFEFFLRSISMQKKGKLFVAANGKGDAENLLEVIREYDGEVVVASVDNCVDVFEGYEVYDSTQAKLLGIDFAKYNIYEYMAKTKWGKSVLQAYRNFYG
jgi:hypothetical protein